MVTPASVLDSATHDTVANTLVNRARARAGVKYVSCCLLRPCILGYVLGARVCECACIRIDILYPRSEQFTIKNLMQRPNDDRFPFRHVSW